VKVVKGWQRDPRLIGPFDSFLKWRTLEPSTESCNNTLRIYLKEFPVEKKLYVLTFENGFLELN